MTQKWIFTCHLVIARPSHKNQQLRMRVPSHLGGVPLFQCLCLLQEPQPQHPIWHLQMSPMPPAEVFKAGGSVRVGQDIAEEIR